MKTINKPNEDTSLLKTEGVNALPATVEIYVNCGCPYEMAASICKLEKSNQNNQNNYQNNNKHNSMFVTNICSV